MYGPDLPFGRLATILATIKKVMTGRLRKNLPPARRVIFVKISTKFSGKKKQLGRNSRVFGEVFDLKTIVSPIQQL